MRKTIMLLLLCLCCCLSFGRTAMAETDPVETLLQNALETASDTSGTFQHFRPVDSDLNPSVTLPKGLDADVAFANGKLNIVIDTEHSDWESVITLSYSSGTERISITPRITLPSNSQGHFSPSSRVLSETTEKRILQSILDVYRADNYYLFTGTTMQNGTGIGSYDQEKRLFTPEESERTMVCAWYDGTDIQFRYLTCSITYTSKDAFYAGLSLVPKDDLILLYDDKLQGKVNATTANGSVQLNVPDNTGLYGSNMQIAVMLPKEAGTENWYCECDMYGETHKISPVISEDYPRPYCIMPLIVDDIFCETDFQGEDDCQLAWYDGNDNFRGCSSFVLQSSSGTPRPWPSYVPNWKPVPAERFSGIKESFYPGLDAVYDEETGILTYQTDPSQFPDSAEFDKTRYRICIAPPTPVADYTQRGYSLTGANNIYGKNDLSWRPDGQLSIALNDAAAYTDSPVYDEPLFHPHYQQGENLVVYTTANWTGDYAGKVLLICWWKADQDPTVDAPALAEYIVIQQEKCTHIMESAPLTEDPTTTIRQPVIVLPQGSINHPEDGLRFIAEIYPQQAESCLYYHLRLVDEDGNPVRLDQGQYKIFLPYPEGLTEDEKASLRLSHMTESHVELENFSINGNSLHQTDAGIWFQAKSFSPFLLEWTPGGTTPPGTSDVSTPASVQSAAPPDTGDASLPLLWLALTILSLFTFAVVTRRWI